MNPKVAFANLDEVELSSSARVAALQFVARMSKERNAIEAEWATSLRLARANGASLREIAEVAACSAQTVANVCGRSQ
jgi:predicted DNA-binding ribbon-helix-helix protein